jgi:VCBS repeat-containing protein
VTERFESAQFSGNTERDEPLGAERADATSEAANHQGSASSAPNELVNEAKQNLAAAHGAGIVDAAAGVGPAAEESGLDKLVQQRDDARKERDEAAAEELEDGAADAAAAEEEPAAAAGSVTAGLDVIAEVIEGIDGAAKAVARVSRPLEGEESALQDDGDEDGGVSPVLLGVLGLAAIGGTVALVAGGASNKPPVAVDDTFAANEGSGTGNFSVATNDTDPNRKNTLTFAANGTLPAGVSLASNGAVTFDSNNAAYNSLAAGQTQVLTFGYTVTDNKGASDTGTVTLTVTGTNDLPVAVADVAAATEGAAAVTGSVRTNDSDVDTNDVLTYALNAPVAGLTLNANGTYSFDPANAAYNNLSAGQTQVVVANYTVSDGRGGTATSTLTITVTGTNDIPVAVADVATATEGSAAVTGSVATNDSDVDANDVLTYALNAPVAGLTLNANGSYSFDPADAAYNSLAAGQTRVVEANYTVSDGRGGTATSTLILTVTGTNDLPVVVADTATATEDAAQVTGTVAANDSDVDATDVLTYTLDAPVAGLLLNNNGTYSFDPQNAAYQSLALGQTQAVVANITVSDGNGGVVPTTLTITVTGTNDAPVAVADVATATEDAAVVTGSVAANDSDVDTGAVLTYTLNAPVAGLTLNPNGTYSFDPSNAAYQSLAVGETINVVAGYTVTDENGASAITTLIITVTGTNDAPVAVADVAVATEDAAAVTGSVATNDSDIDNGAVLTYALNAPVAGLTLNPSGSYSFDPSNAAYQSLAAGQTQVVVANYTVSDGNGGTATSTLTITVTGTNDVPVAVADVAAATEDGAVVTGSMRTNDSDVDATDVLTYTLDAPVAGLTLNANGTYSFDPSNAAYQSLAAGQTQVVTANVTVSDGNGGVVPSTLTITVTGTNDVPVAVADVAAATEDGAVVTGSMRTNDSDVDTTDVLTYTLDTPVAGLTLAANGTYTFDPTVAAYQFLAAGETLDVVANITVNDGNGGVVPSTLTITVTGTNDAPVAVADVAAATEDGVIVSGSVATNDSDVDATDVLTYTLDTPVAGLTLAANGTYTFDPTVAAYQFLAAGETLDVVANITVNDGNGGVVPSTLTITVTGANDAPVLTSPATANVDENEPAGTVVYQATVVDPDLADTLTYTLSGPDALLFAVSATGAVSQLAPFNFEARSSYNFTVNVSDGTVSDSVDVALTVNNVLDIANLDIDSDGDINSVQQFSGLGQNFQFTDSAGIASNVEIINFGTDDFILVDSATSNYTFSSINDGSNALFDDLIITINNAGDISQIVIQDAVAAGSFILSEADAEAAVGYDFFQSGVIVAPPPPPPAAAASPAAASPAAAASGPDGVTRR